jgi:two-component system sensor histidine kinase BaeS
VRHGPPWGKERPGWWPANEPFPPQGADVPRMRRRFMQRMGCFFFGFIVVFALIVAVLVSVFTQLFSAAGASNGNLFAIIVFGGIALVFISTVLRAVRRVVMPLGDLIDAAESVEAGDFSVRVRSRGPRELRSLARAFNAMSEHLGRSETERRRLLADVTHELRTPLTVIQGNLEALIDGVRPTDEAHLRAILEDTHVLARLIDDLRTISVAEAGALALQREPTDVGALVRETTGSFGSMADAAGVTLSANASGDLSASVDPIRVREVLTNIIANALRYTPRGGSVAVTVTPWPDHLTVSVRDTGPGIAADVLPHVFDRFTRSPESPGAGLGLAIAKSLVTAHGGTIDATSAPGQGTDIRFTLPRREAREPA